MEMIKELLSRNMKALRKEKGWTQDDLAEKAGYSTSFVADIERGKSWVSPDSIERICGALEVSCDKLFSSEKPGKMFDMPMSKAIQKLMAIPDDVYEMAQKVDPKDEIWGTVLDALEIAAERNAKKQIKDA